MIETCARCGQDAEVLRDNLCPRCWNELGAWKLAKDAPSSGAAPAGEPLAKPSPTALAGGGWTPGPWKANGVYIEAVVPPIGRTFWIIASCALIRYWAAGRTLDHAEREAQANAHLIAAAPDLYEALKEAEEVICGAGLVEEFPIWVIDLIDAALAKARGEKPESTSTEADEGQEAGTRSQD